MSAQSQGFLWQISCKVPDPAVDLFEEFLRQFCVSVSSRMGVDDSLWIVDGLSEVEPDRAGVEGRASILANDAGFDTPTFTYDLVPPINWAAENLTAFRPVQWGRYYIHGSHIEPPATGGVIPLKLDAGTAFGSGEHPTTAGCLMALDGLARKRRFYRPLDVGCGSGILALAMAKTWNGPVLCSDIDPEAVRVTTENARLNRVGNRIRAIVSDGYQHRTIIRNGLYDLITSNILARPLIRMTRSLSRVLEPGGIAVISGLVERDAPWLIASYRQVGLRLLQHRAIQGWSTLILSRCQTTSRKAPSQLLSPRSAHR